MIDKLLSKLEAFTRTDISYVLSGSFWFTAGSAIQALIGLVLAIGFANLLPKEVYGSYQFIISTALIISAFSLTGLNQAVTRTVAKGASAALRAILLTSLRWSVLTGVLAVCVSIYFFLTDDLTLSIAFLVAGVFTPLTDALALYHPYLVGKEEFRKSVMLGLWRRALPVAALLVVLWFSDNLILIVTTYFLANAAALGLLFFQVSRLFPGSAPIDKEGVQLAKHLSIMAIPGRIVNNLDQVIIFYLLGPASVAVWAIAKIPVKQLQNILGNVHKIVLPKLARNSMDELQRTLSRKVWFFLASVLVVVVLYILIVPIFFALAFPQYVEAVEYTQAFSLLLLTVPFSVFTKALIAHNRTIELYIGRVSVPIIKLVLLFTLIPLWGLWGVIYAVVGSQCIYALLVYVLFRYSYRSNSLGSR